MYKNFSEDIIETAKSESFHSDLENVDSPVQDVIIFESPLGKIHAAATENGVSLLEFENEERTPANPELNVNPLKVISDATQNKHLQKLEIELREYFSGERKEFTIALDPSGTPFQLKVWKSLMGVPYGEVRSYKAQSISLGNPLAIRAMARANGRNPVAILIPCHRIIGENGSLTGYSGGLWRKKWLLKFESKNGEAGEWRLF